MSGWQQDWLGADVGSLVTTGWQGFDLRASLAGRVLGKSSDIPTLTCLGGYSSSHSSWGLRALSLRASFCWVGGLGLMPSVSAHSEPARPAPGRPHLGLHKGYLRPVGPAPLVRASSEDTLACCLLTSTSAHLERFLPPT